MAGQLGKIVDYIDQLQRVEAAGAGRLDGRGAAGAGRPDGGGGAGAAGGTPAPVRGAPEAADVPGPCLPRETFLANAPAALDGFLLVPEVRRSPGSSGAQAGVVSHDEPV